jgi:prolyl 4-hydroxylase
MAPSKVSLMDKDKGKEAKEFRTSSTYFLTSRGDGLLKDVDERVANLTRTTPQFHEDVQVGALVHCNTH